VCPKCGIERWVRRGTKNPQCPDCDGNGNKRLQRSKRWHNKPVALLPTVETQTENISPDPLDKV
jgi:hypothetical protein